MKKILALTASSLLIFNLSAQNNSLNILDASPTLNGIRANPRAYCGIGTYQISAVPNQNLQIHGVAEYIRGVQTNKLVVGPDGEMGGGMSPISINYGVTSAISLTNSVTGAGVEDGAILRMSQNNFTIDNLEANGNIILAANGANMVFQGSTKRVYTGGTFFNIANQFASFNIWGENTNALNVRSAGANGNGIFISTPNTALAVFNNNIKNFTVKGSGEVYARKYTTTLANIPDYVFEKDYQLMPLKDLKSYISTNKHLPNIPSAKEIEANEGQVDLGEMNRLLLEKVEESMLYILQLEERLKALEDK
jgi:hypothetical protein